jgi:hypothetical protein
VIKNIFFLNENDERNYLCMKGMLYSLRLQLTDNKNKIKHIYIAKDGFWWYLYKRLFNPFPFPPLSQRLTKSTYNDINKRVSAIERQ